MTSRARVHSDPVAGDRRSTNASHCGGGPAPVIICPMRTTPRPPNDVVDHARRSDARLALSTVAASVVGFAVLVVLPYAVNDFAPPAGLDILWSLGGPLALVLAPIAAGLAGFASGVALWRHGDLHDTTRRLHLVVLVAVATFAVFLASHPGQSAISWWQD